MAVVSEETSSVSVTEAVRRRISCRAYLPTQISQAELAYLLDKAQRAPSGGNIQPWKVVAVAGVAKDEVIALASRALATVDPTAPVQLERPIYPDFRPMDPVYNARRRDVGELMYKALGVPKEDREGRLRWFANNYRFFGAPVGLFFVIDKRMGHGQWAHMGMYMQTIMLLAVEQGWATCPQECWARLRNELHAHFKLGEHDMIYCGMSLGVPDPNHPVNSMYSERAMVGDVATFHGF